MRCASFFCAGLVALTLAAPSRAQTYTIKFKHGPDAGKSIVVTSKDKGTNSVTVTDADGKVLKQDKAVTQGKEEVYTDTVVEKGDKKPKKFKRVYEKANRTAGGKTTPLPYEGRTVVFELKDGKYEATAEGTPALPKEVLAELTGKANSGDEESEEVLLPKKAIKAGDKWAIDTKALLADRSAKGAEKMVLDPDKSKAEAALTKVYEKDGKQFGILDVTMKLAVKSVADLTFDDKPAALDVQMTLDVCIDGSGTAFKLTETSKLAGKGTTTVMGMKLTVELSGDSTRTSEQSAEK